MSELEGTPLFKAARMIATVNERANAVAMHAARINASMMFAKQIDKNRMLEIVENITHDIVCVAEGVESVSDFLNEANQDFAMSANAIREEANAKIAAAQQSDCHPKHNATIRKQVWDLTGGKCAYCDTALAPDGNGSLSFVVEHVVPTSQGGPDNLANYVPACMSCNTSKGADHVLLFIQRRFPNRTRPAQPYVPERME